MDGKRRGDQRIVFLHQAVWIRPGPIGALRLLETTGDARVYAHCFREGGCVIEKEPLRPTLIGFAYETRNLRPAMVLRKPSAGARQVWIFGISADRE